MLGAAIAGAVFGFVGSMPVAGPIAVLVLARCLEGRRREGVLIGVGAALAEAAYAFLAYRGFTAFLAELPWIVPASRAVGVVLLTIIGLGLLRRRDATARPPDEPHRATSLALGLTISALNPTFLVTWTALVGILGSIAPLDPSATAAGAFAAAVAAGVAGWFATAAWLVERFRDRIGSTTLARCHRAFGWLVLVLAAVLAAAFVEGVATT